MAAVVAMAAVMAVAAAAEVVAVAAGAVETIRRWKGRRGGAASMSQAEKDLVHCLRGTTTDVTDQLDPRFTADGTCNGG